MRDERLFPLFATLDTLSGVGPKLLPVLQRLCGGNTVWDLLLHLPDRDITLARGSDKAQLKVVVRDGRTVKIVVRSGEIAETLTVAGAVPIKSPGD